MPADLFGSKASVQTCIYLFKVAKRHETDDIVKFIDMSEDGYTRMNRKKSSTNVNLRDTDHAYDRYEEVVAILLDKKPKTQYYTKENGKLICDTISLNGEDWGFSKHKPKDIRPTDADFRETVAEYLSWKVEKVSMNGGCVDE